MNELKLERYLSIALYLCGFLYWNQIGLIPYGMGVTIFTVIIVIVSAVYLSKAGYKQNRDSLICLILILVTSAQYAIFSNMTVLFFNYLFLLWLFYYWVALTTGNRVENKISSYLPIDLLRQIFVVPFANFNELLRNFKKEEGTGKKSEFWAILLGILAFVPLIFLVIALLSSADNNFAELFDRILKSFDFGNIEKYLWQSVLAIPLAFYLYGLIFGNAKGKRGDKNDTSAINEQLVRTRFVPAKSIYSGMTILNVIYLTFLAIQVSYLFSAFKSVLPAGFTYAEYARQGFFELCVVAGLNLLTIILSSLFIKRKDDDPKILKFEIAGICLFTLLLIITALRKMVMYIDIYGLTQLRVLTSWFMFGLFLIFLLVLVRQFVKFNIAKPLALSATAWFLIMAYANIDRIIVKYNVERFGDKILFSEDQREADYYSNDSLPYLYEVYEKSSDAEVRKNIRNILIHNDYYRDSEDYLKTYYALRANEIRKNLSKSK